MPKRVQLAIKGNIIASFVDMVSISSPDSYQKRFSFFALKHVESFGFGFLDYLLLFLVSHWLEAADYDRYEGHDHQTRVGDEEALGRRLESLCFVGAVGQIVFNDQIA